nr:hypothetical protein [Endozoicomonas sp.]
KYIERSLNDFHTDGKPLEGRSIIIIDKKTEELLRKPSPGSKSLYDRLSDIGVMFVHVENKEHKSDIHDFIKEKFGTDSLKTGMDLFKKIPLPLKEEGFDYGHFRSVAYQLICPAYAYSLDKTLDSVAVIDADSLAPLGARSISLNVTRAAMPISLRGGIFIDQGDETEISVLFDFEFFKTLNGYTWIEIKGIADIVMIVRITFAFKEINSRAAANDLARSTLARIKSYIDEPRWQINKSGDELHLAESAYITLGSIIDSQSQIENMCFLNCLYFDRYSVHDCSEFLSLKCFKSDRDFQALLLGTMLNSAYAASLVRSLKENANEDPSIRLCLNSEKHEHSKKNIYPTINECWEQYSAQEGVDYEFYSFEDAGFGVMFDRQQLSNMTHLFSNPMKEWGVVGSEEEYLWDAQQTLIQPRFLPIVSEAHGRGLRDGNLTAITSLTEETTPGTSVDGIDYSIKYGAASGLLDELMDRFGLQDACSSLVYSMVRGYLFGQIPGCLLGGLGSTYCHWIEPRLGDGQLKSFLSYAVPKSFLLARAAQNPVGTACSFIGYQGTRTIIQKLFPG